MDYLTFMERMIAINFLSGRLHIFCKLRSASGFDYIV